MKTIYKIITVCLFVLFIPISLYSMFESKSALPIVSLTELEKKYDDMDVVKQFQLIYPDYSIESGPIQGHPRSHFTYSATNGTMLASLFTDISSNDNEFAYFCQNLKTSEYQSETKKVTASDLDNTRCFR